MSYLRMGQDGTYVEIPGGSNYYLYGSGSDIGGWSHAEFASLIGSVVHELEPWAGEPTPDEVLAGFEEHFGGWDPDYGGGITPPERAEIFCQCVDTRIEGLELTDELHDAVRAWADDFDALRECQYCGAEFRPHLYVEPYVCSDEACERRGRADNYDVPVSVVERAERIFGHLHYDYDYSISEASAEDVAYIIEQSPKDFSDHPHNPNT